MTATRRRFISLWLREPLIHFLVLGTALAGIYGWTAARPRRIVLSSDAIHGLRQEYLRRNGKLPDGAEEAAMVQRFIDDEILYREALAQGLDRGDVIVRRRLVQKMEFIIEGMDPVPSPAEAELQAYLDAHAERYAIPDRLTLTQVYLSNERHARNGETVALELRRRLLAGDDAAALGDPFIHGGHFELQTERQLAGIFGDAFAHALMSRATPGWSPPLRSSYGWHLVRIDERQPGYVPSLAEVRTAVRRDWEAERRADMDRDAMERLRRRYDIALPAAADAAGAAASVREAG